MFRIDDIAARLRSYDPALLDIPNEELRVRAAVAVVLHESDAGAELLFIRRAEVEGDPWSGDIAFPGGRIDPDDAHARAAAERETHEELGIALDGAELIGRLDDLTGTSKAVLVSAFVYQLAEPPAMTLNHEVDDAWWTPLAQLAQPDRHIVRGFSYADRTVELPALRLIDGDDDAPVLWGLTYRFLEILMRLVERPIPRMPWRNDL